MNRTPRRVLPLCLALALGFSALGQAEQGSPPLGFAPASAAVELEAEQRLAAELSTDRISQFHRLLTRQPHIAGTPGGRAVADEIARTLRGFGLETEVRTYDAYLSHPVDVRLRLLRPVARALAVREPSHPGDPDSRHPGLMAGFIAYSASGRVRGPVVYVNYGLPSDYEALAAAGVKVRGVILLARYGRVHRAVKVYTAEQQGARGILIYSDPADDGYMRGDTWPAGPWRAAQFLQRGNAKYSWFWHGDPLTPGAPAVRQVVRLKPEAAPTLPRIPAAVISWSAARQILSRLKGPGVPRGFQGGLPFAYHAGPGPAEVELDVKMDARVRPITNVLGGIVGAEEPDRWVILGTHHDAWTFGGVDPGSAAAVVLELARALAALRASGWQPRRTILFAFWDAEEYGLVGSTEYAEEFARELAEKAVAYINSDLYLAGRFEAGGVASLRDFVVEVARAVSHPASSKGTVHSEWREAAWDKLSRAEKHHRRQGFEVELEPLGSGADFVAFQDFLGLPTLSLEFGIEGSYGVYHSNYDTRFYMEKFGDPGWRYGLALAELLGRAVLRLASAELLPLRFSHTAQKLEDYLRELEEHNLDSGGNSYREDLNLATARAAVAVLGEQARHVEQAAAEALARGSLDPVRRREVNDCLTRAEKSFAVSEPRPGQPLRWYRHTVYGWDIYALYSGQTLPALHRALVARNAAEFAAERARLEQAIQRAGEELARAAARLR